jgi:hypothetical protein
MMLGFQHKVQKNESVPPHVTTILLPCEPGQRYIQTTGPVTKLGKKCVRTVLITSSKDICSEEGSGQMLYLDL